MNARSERHASKELARWVVPMFVGLVTVVAFLPALGAGFVSWDDDTNFLRNPMYRGLGWTQLKWMWTTFLMGHYVPLSWMTLGLDYELWGMNAAGYHLGSVLLHAANAVLLYFVARSLMQSALGDGTATFTVPAAFAALLFSIHPLRVESVAWITERRDVLSGFFYLAAVLCYLRSTHRDQFGRWYWLAVAMFLCALLSKATAVTLPVVLLILNVHPLQRLAPRMWRGASARRVYLELFPLAMLSAVAGALSLVALDPPQQLTFAGKIAASAYSLGFYLWKTLFPVNLAPLYEMPTHVDPIAPVFLASYAAVVALLVFVWVLWRRWPGAGAAWVAFLAMILPLLGVVQNGQQIAADRYTYQAMQALAILGGACLAVSTRRGATAAAAALLLLWGALTWKQTRVWRDSETLWNRVLQVDSGSSVAHTALANVLFSQDRLDEAIVHYRLSLAINPSSLEVDNNLGVALAKQEKLTEAIVHYRQAIAINPSHYEAHNNLGAALARVGNASAAIEHFRDAVAINPDFADAEINWGNALVRLEKTSEAIGHYRSALAIRPNDADAEHNWGVALAQRGDYPEAIGHFRRAIAINPNHAEARQYLLIATRMQQGRTR